MNSIGLCIILIGHVLGDFYLRGGKTAEGEQSPLKNVLIHCAAYSAVMAAILLCSFEWPGVLLLWPSLSLAHLTIDAAELAILKTGRRTRAAKLLKKRGVIISQFLHIALIFVLWSLFERNLTVRGFFLFQSAAFPKNPVVIILAALTVIRPAGLIIGRGEIWDLGSRAVASPEAGKKNAGRMIGYLERVIILLFIIYGQFGSIAFVITAKSVARFKEIENDRSLAEYYLIGTLLSVSFALATAVALGLC